MRTRRQLDGAAEISQLSHEELTRRLQHALICIACEPRPRDVRCHGIAKRVCESLNLPAMDPDDVFDAMVKNQGGTIPLGQPDQPALVLPKPW